MDATFSIGMYGLKPFILNAEVLHSVKYGTRMCATPLFILDHRHQFFTRSKHFNNGTLSLFLCLFWDRENHFILIFAAVEKFTTIIVKKPT